MNYDEKWLEGFDGNINSNTISMSELANSLEKYVSQYEYVYSTNLPDFSEIKINVLNTNIPHLMGLSKSHHYGLPTYHSEAIFEGLKRDWDLEKLKQGDVRWFSENQEKLIGCLFLYQMLNIIDCSIYTTITEGTKHFRLERDNIYFIIFKYPGSNSYSIELTPENSSDGRKTYTPRSLKINDSIEENCREVELTLNYKKRIKGKKKKRYEKWI